MEDHDAFERTCSHLTITKSAVLDATLLPYSLCYVFDIPTSNPVLMKLCNDSWTSDISILLIEIIWENGKIRLNDTLYDLNDKRFDGYMGEI